MGICGWSSDVCSSVLSTELCERDRYSGGVRIPIPVLRSTSSSSPGTSRSVSNQGGLRSCGDKTRAVARVSLSPPSNRHAASVWGASTGSHGQDSPQPGHLHGPASPHSLLQRLSRTRPPAHLQRLREIGRAHV